MSSPSDALRFATLRTESLALRTDWAAPGDAMARTPGPSHRERGGAVPQGDSTLPVNRKTRNARDTKGAAAAGRHHIARPAAAPADLAVAGSPATRLPPLLASGQVNEATSIVAWPRGAVK